MMKGYLIISLGIRIRILPNPASLEILYSKVVSGALYNFGGRFDPPKCHPNTQTAILKDLVDWLHQPISALNLPTNNTLENPSPMPAKICRTFAQVSCDKGQLSLTFFFSRTSDTGRNDETHSVAALAYDVEKHIPKARPHIYTALLNDPLTLNLSLKSPVNALLVTPLI
ncbi:hypothetical protein GALMADRAFT_106165 [Galerina marginata CBS 339.88]|uniref:Uncharacterized protein n=1 Tax=Galerina marginata (strain CBS 339.88) TaxID=685588 RepID=A0A067SFM0_GALM3|nr:hypothetical protein GALMADRAFT_106165 [Galerina marginata CBS 339.88]